MGNAQPAHAAACFRSSHLSHMNLHRRRFKLLLVYFMVYNLNCISTHYVLQIPKIPLIPLRKSLNAWKYKGKSDRNPLLSRKRAQRRRLYGCCAVQRSTGLNTHVFAAVQ